MSKRNTLLDTLKGITIILVVVGHCIQVGNGIEYSNSQIFFNNIIFRIIYSFHMPLFMLISGYLFYYSCRKYNTSELIKAKITRCIIPIFTWGIIYGIILFLKNKCENNIFFYLSNSFYMLTFFKALFICAIIVLIIYKSYNDSWYAYLIMITLSLLITDNTMNFTNFLFPFFILGFQYNKNKEKVKSFFNKKRKIILFTILLIIYLILFKKFVYNKYIYTNTYSLITNFSNLWTNIYRFLIGLIGSVLLIMIIDEIKNKLEKIKIFKIFGENTDGIYILSCYINYLILNDNLTANLTFSYINVFIESILILIITTTLTILINKSKILRKYLLGRN